MWGFVSKPISDRSLPTLAKTQADLGAQLGISSLFSGRHNEGAKSDSRTEGIGLQAVWLLRTGCPGPKN